MKLSIFRSVFGLGLFEILLTTILCASAAENDPKSAARDWQQSKVNRLGSFRVDPYVVIPLDIPSGTLTSRRAEVEESLQGIYPNKGQKSKSKILSDGRYILYGDLFLTREIYALVELPVEPQTDPGWDGGAVAFAQFSDGKWLLRGLWDVSTNWSEKPSDDDHWPVTPAKVPFELVDFDNDQVPEVLMAGEIWKYYQYYYLLRFNRQTRTLDLLAEAMGRPKGIGGYVVLYYNSGHRAIFEEWRFAKLAHGELKEVASWHDGTPYNEGDDEGLRVRVPNQHGTMERLDLEESEDGYVIKRASETLATVTFAKKKQAPFFDGEVNWDNLKNVWLFHHLTGLPGGLLNGDAKLPKFSDYLSVTVTGQKDFVRRLKISDHN